MRCAKAFGGRLPLEGPPEHDGLGGGHAGARGAGDPMAAALPKLQIAATPPWRNCAA